MCASLQYRSLKIGSAGFFIFPPRRRNDLCRRGRGRESCCSRRPLRARLNEGTSAFPAVLLFLFSVRAAREERNSIVDADAEGGGRAFPRQRRQKSSTFLPRTQASPLKRSVSHFKYYYDDSGYSRRVVACAFDNRARLAFLSRGDGPARR